MLRLAKLFQMLSKITASIALDLYTNVSLSKCYKKTFEGRDIQQGFVNLSVLCIADQLRSQDLVSFEVSWFIQFNPLRTQAITRLSSANGIVEYYVNRIGWIHIKHVHMVVNVCYNVCTLYTFAYIHKYRYWQFKRLCFIAAWIATTMYFPI